MDAKEARKAKADLAEILERRPDLKGKSIEAVRRILRREAAIAQTSKNLTEVDLAERSDDRLARLDPGQGRGDISAGCPAAPARKTPPPSSPAG